MAGCSFTLLMISTTLPIGAPLPRINRIDYVNAARPERIKDYGIGYGFKGTDCIDTGLRHERAILFDVTGKIEVLGMHLALGDGVPIDPLDMKRHSVHNERMSFHLDLRVDPSPERAS